MNLRRVFSIRMSQILHGIYLYPPPKIHWLSKIQISLGILMFLFAEKNLATLSMRLARLFPFQKWER